MNRVQAAEQMRRALQMFAATLTEKQAMEVAAVFDRWKIGRHYTSGDYLTYDVNGVGDPQLYKVAQDHTSQADWAPDRAFSLYVAIGLDAQGYPVWAQPSGSHDGYNKGDIVNYHGTLYRSCVDANVYSPEAFPENWEIYLK